MTQAPAGPGPASGGREGAAVNGGRVFCAIDAPSVAAATALAGRLGGLVGGLKLGLEFFAAAGPEGVRTLADMGLPVFLDLKLHDIPNTVAGALRSVLPLAPAFVTLHAAGGSAMMRAAAEVARSAEADGRPRPRLLAVTVLTSLSGEDLAATGQDPDLAAQVARLAILARDSGMDGAVCAPHEIAMLRRLCGPGFTLMVPGIRPPGSEAHDQKRTMAPAEAIRAGADHLVIGRPITAAPDPAAAARRIAAELAAA